MSGSKSTRKACNSHSAVSSWFFLNLRGFQLASRPFGFLCVRFPSDILLSFVRGNSSNVQWKKMLENRA